MKRLFAIPALWLTVTLFPGEASGATSKKLTDVIKSNGQGDIAVLKDVTATDLEALRVENAGSVVFGVDINEAADGYEKASAQGVAILSARLDVVRGGNTTSYTEFETETKALVASAGSTTRTERFTLLGESGSSRITGTTGSSAIRNEFDSTLTFTVPDSLTGATSVKLIVTLVTVNANLGMPENYYDFTNGFEDLAVLSKADADFFNGIGTPNLLEQSTFQTESPAVVLTNPPDTSMVVAGWTYYPSATGYYLVAYEDRAPEHGDYDFNDLVVAYRIGVGKNSANQILAVSGTSYLVARGASYDHDWTIRVTLPASTTGTLSCTTFVPDGDPQGAPCANQTTGSITTAQLQVKAHAGTRSAFTDPSPSADFPFAVNTAPGESFVPGPRTVFYFGLTAPLSGDLAGAPFLPLLDVKGTGESVELSDRDTNGYPFGLILPDAWMPPYEVTDLAHAYTSFLDWVTSSGTSSQTWYQSAASGRVFVISRGQWAW